MYLEQTVGDVNVVPSVSIVTGSSVLFTAVPLVSDVAGCQNISSTVSPCNAQFPHPRVQPGPRMVVFEGQTSTCVVIPSMVVAVVCASEK
jgi:hypothetical protein